MLMLLRKEKCNLPVEQIATKVCACRLIVSACDRSIGNRDKICSKKSWGVMAERSHFNFASTNNSQSCKKEIKKFIIMINSHQKQKLCV